MASVSRLSNTMGSTMGSRLLRHSPFGLPTFPAIGFSKNPSVSPASACFTSVSPASADQPKAWCFPRKCLAWSRLRRSVAKGIETSVSERLPFVLAPREVCVEGRWGSPYVSTRGTGSSLDRKWATLLRADGIGILDRPVEALKIS